MSHKSDLSVLDRQDILEIIFPLAYSPFCFSPMEGNRVTHDYTQFIEVESGIKIECGFWGRNKHIPTILYFHGNGETVSDYSEIAQAYNQIGVNFFVCDYRGYGMSDGKPTITNLIGDAHFIYKGFRNILDEEGYELKIFLMGRSLGSMPAVEVAYRFQDEISGLIIESGAANNLQRLWSYLDPSVVEKLKGSDFLNKEKIKKVLIPTLIIHGQEDEVLPIEEGIELYDSSGAEQKDILVVSGAGHNDLMLMGQGKYFRKIKEFINNT